jgi:hypothetical protein
LQTFFDEAHNPVFRLGISGDAAMAVRQFWQQVDPNTGALLHDFTDPAWNTRFLGDLYQDLSEATRKRVAGGLLKAGVDLGLLQGRVKRRFTAYYLADEPLLYVLLQALASNRTTAAALADPRWLWFRLPEAELEHRLLLLHQAQVISYYRAGSVVDLKLPASSAEALVQEVWS